MTDDVIRHARTDIMLVKYGRDRIVPRRILLPTAGGAHARKAQTYATDLVGAGGQLTLCAVLKRDAPQSLVEEQSERLVEERDEMDGGDSVRTTVVKGDSVAEGVIEAGRDYDAIMVGSATQSFSSQLLFGTIPERIAQEADSTVIVVKSHRRVRALVGRIVAD